MSTSSPQPYGTQRQAAARNRVAILEVAHELFAANPAVSLNEVAKQAGVGAGTLYRHFPTREDLVLAVYRHDVQRLVDSVDTLLATRPPREAFVDWFETLAAYIRVKHGLGEALHNAAIQEAINDTYAPVTAAVGKLLDACVADGSIKPDCDPGDVVLLMSFLWRVAPNDDGAAQGRRLIELVFDGIGR
ncbi:TetR/AcrR family transcriptional regulator [Mycobacteroides abscessus]|uniref:TetR/AcrR family transcriptional regulator n=1 Tax=Mycobacteroides abscessus TaxID=36809 RepID=UPI00030D70C9|nr:TetR/AcrR family transcriptional regulator [Mycobacteroides abscessus]AMU33388.1 TetR family transcriptional regulator [Mycobacteroides abscessus]AMU77897.1 TetR family transcriptional regulator [Mycobacteroides abscessus]ANO01554.1 TetR family transcriptional regulator [Mycobacteroides abscessus]ANO26854.1 TetR family transcriptional regulator [Mycobacteroides abscessus]MDB2197617.1 TetR/AcrR family transcriptional regulator [Mycobacteroides abscessus subsp. abscessus]